MVPFWSICCTNKIIEIQFCLLWKVYIVVGKVTVENGLASYKSQAEGLGIEKVLKEMNGQ